MFSSIEAILDEMRGARRDGGPKIIRAFELKHGQMLGGLILKSLL